LLEQNHAKVANPGQDRRCMACADATGVFAKDDIQAPVRAVLHAPVTAHRMSEAFGVGGDGVDEETPLHAVTVRDPALTPDQADAAQSHPTPRVGQGAQLLSDPVAAHFQAPVVLVGLLGVVVHDSGEATRGRGGEELSTSSCSVL
jgi:hypothetical protein